MFIFNSASEFYRHPQGGIKAGEEISIKIYVKKNNPKPNLIIEKRSDYNSEFYKEQVLEWIKTENSYELYKTTFTINNYGQYFYYFAFSENNHTEKYELLIYKEGYTTPHWVKGGTIYHIFVDRFYRSKILDKDADITIRNDWGGIPNYLPDEEYEIRNNDFFGGNLEGIKEKLPYLSDLGVSVLYLSPIFEAYSNHKYDVGDYLSIDPMFGDEKSFEELCQEAEKYNIYIIIDGVFSHTGDDSIYFNKYNNYKSLGAYQSISSPYYEWYIFNKWNSDYVSWWGIKTLPTINKENSNFIDFITGENGVLKFWQQRGVKGWRLDVADELPNEFLEKLRTAVKSQNNENFIVGEVWEDASTKFSYGKLKEYFCGNQLDSVTNYPLRNAIIDYVKNKDCKALYETMNFITEKYPPQTMNCLMNILGTHDTGRILTLLGTETISESKEEKALSKLSDEELENGIKLLKIATVLQFTLPGVPCIYYGDEVGMEGFEDPFNRTCFPWGDENQEILNHYKELSNLRKNHVFKEGKYKCLIHDKEVFVFERYQDEERITIAINLSPSTITLNLKETNKSHDIPTQEYLII